MFHGLSVGGTHTDTDTVKEVSWMIRPTFLRPWSFLLRWRRTRSLAKVTAFVRDVHVSFQETLPCAYLQAFQVCAHYVLTVLEMVHALDPVAFFHLLSQILLIRVSMRTVPVWGWAGGVRMLGRSDATIATKESPSVG